LIILSDIFLSIIFPAYNEEHRLPSAMEKVSGFLENQSYSSEIIIVENGSQDKTLEVARAFAQDHHRFRVFHEDGRGKGLAVRRGMLEARGEHRFMCDVDLSMPIEQVSRFLPPVLSSYDVCIASREAPGAKRFNEPGYRHLGGRLVNFMIRVLALPGLQDTQCGFKCFRADVADDLFNRQRLMGWSFDVEILYIARMRGYRIVELPIPWYFSPESKVNPVKDAIKMARDILEIRQNARAGFYGEP
jgi:glycosyltransferase involved in cell wall biosynthesis